MGAATRLFAFNDPIFYLQVQQDTVESMSTVVQLDKIKDRMLITEKKLKQADNWCVLNDQIDLLFDEQVIRRYTHRQADRHTDTHRHRHTDTDTHRHRHTQTHRHTDTQTHRHTDTHCKST